MQELSVQLELSVDAPASALLWASAREHHWSLQKRSWVSASAHHCALEAAVASAVYASEAEAV